MGRLSLRDGARPEGFHLALLLAEAAQQLRQLILREHPGCTATIGDCTGLCSFYAEKGGLIVGYEGA